MKSARFSIFFILLLLPHLAGCSSAALNDGAAVSFRVSVDGDVVDAQVAPAATVGDAIAAAGLTLGELDRVTPPTYTGIEPNLTITITRIREDTVVLEEVIPFERHTTINDAMPQNDSRLLQAGVNGVAEVTYRILYEDGIEVNRGEIRRALILESQDEIIMTGSQNTLQTVTVRGTLLYISRGNLWMMSSNSLNRRPLTLEGNSDGRVISVSPDGKNLLFTVQVTEEERERDDFNRLLYMNDFADPDSSPVDTGLKNILFAEFYPDETDTFAFSTAEPRADFPGWQANNDLWRASLSANGRVRDEKQLVESSSGGIYGWFGTFLKFGATGETLAWARPDGAGMLVAYYDDRDRERADIKGYYPVTLITFEPKNPYDFVWVPEFSLSPDGRMLAITAHGAPLGNEEPGDSEVYDLLITPVNGGFTIPFSTRVGMWSAPRYSPLRISDDGSLDYSIAYLRAEKPLNSQTSPYRLIIADRDGSESRILFPALTDPGMRSADQDFAWSPDGGQIALTYLGNLTIVDTATGLAQQLSQDGQTSHPIWLP